MNGSIDRTDDLLQQHNAFVQREWKSLRLTIVLAIIFSVEVVLLSLPWQV